MQNKFKFEMIVIFPCSLKFLPFLFYSMDLDTNIDCRKWIVTPKESWPNLNQVLGIEQAKIKIEDTILMPIRNTGKSFFSIVDTNPAYESINFHVFFSENICSDLGVAPSNGIYLFGPPGKTNRTLLC